MATLLMIESWLQSTGIALPRRIMARGHRYVLVTRDPEIYPRDHPVRTHAADVLHAETNDTDALVTTATRYAAEHEVDGVLTTCDYYLDAAAQCAHALALPGPVAQAMYTATRKHRVRDISRRAGIPTPAYTVADTWEAARLAGRQFGYPVVAKPVDLNSGTSVRLVDDETALKDAFVDVTGRTHNTRGQPLSQLLLVEEYLIGPEVSIEAVTVAGRTQVVGITEKIVDPLTLVETAHLFPARLSKSQEAAAASHAAEILAAIGFDHGVSHTELKLTAHGPRIVEVNPRQAGGHIFDLVNFVTGTDLLGSLIDLALGHRPRIGTAGDPIDPGQRVAGAAVSFVLPPLTEDAVRQAAPVLDADPNVQAWDFTPSPLARGVRDNNERAGYVIATDSEHPGQEALRYAYRAVESALGRPR